MAKPPQSNLEALLEELLVEGRFEDAQAKYPDAAEDLAQLKAAGINSKYAQWFGKTWSNLGPQTKDQYPLKQVVEFFKVYDQMLQKKLISDPRQRDINSFSQWEEWVEFVGELKEKAQQRDQEKKRESDAEVFYKDSRYLIIQPKSEEASCKLGRNTKWCISATDSKNYFEKYTDRGALFYFIIDRKTNDKDALAVYKDENTSFEIFDAADNPSTLSYLIDKYPEKLHETIYRLAYGKRYEAFAKAVENPIEGLQDYEGDGAEFLVSVYERISTKHQVKFLQDLLMQLSPEQPMPEKVKDFLHELVSYTSFPIGAHFNEYFTLAERSRQLDSAFPFLQEMTLDLYSFASKALEDDNVDLQAYANFMKILVELVEEEEYEDWGLLTQAFYSAIVNPDGDTLFDFYQNHPDIFTRVLENAFVIWPGFRKSENFERLLAKLVGAKYEIPSKIGYKFTIALGGLWKYIHQFLDKDDDGDFTRILRMLFKAARANADEIKWALDNSDLLYRLTLESKGDPLNLLSLNINSLQEGSRRKAMRFIRKDMSRFFPGLITD